MPQAHATPWDRLQGTVRPVAVLVALAAMILPAFAQSPPTVRFVQQRGLLYIPVDIMVSGGVLQAEATKQGLGRIEATATALSGPGPVLDALLSGAADYGTAALPSLLTIWEKTRGSANEIRAVGAVTEMAPTVLPLSVLPAVVLTPPPPTA